MIPPGAEINFSTFHNTCLKSKQLLDLYEMK